MGNLPPAYFFGLYRAVVEPVFIYGAEACTGTPKRLTNKIDDLQLRFARFLLALPRTTGRYTVLNDLGVIPITWKLLHLKARFLAYAGSATNRPIWHAMQDSLELWKVSGRGWFACLLKEAKDIGDVFRRGVIENKGEWTVQTTLGEDVLEALKEKFQKDLVLSVEDKSRGHALWIAGVKIRRKKTGLMKAPYTVLPLHLSGPLARMQHSAHRLRVETGRWTKVAREERVCDCGSGVESEWHAIVACRFYSESREVLWEMLMGMGGDGKQLLELRFFQMVMNPPSRAVLGCAKFIREISKRTEARWEGERG